MSQLRKQDGFIESVVSLFFSIIIAIVGIRFVFRLLGANPDNGLVSWVYNASQPLVSPFFGIFNHDINILTGRFEWETLLALIVYGMIAAVVSSLLAGFHRTHTV